MAKRHKITTEWYRTNEELDAELHSLARTVQLLRMIWENPDLNDLVINLQLDDLEKMLLEQIFVLVPKDAQKGFLRLYNLEDLEVDLEDMWMDMIFSEIKQ